MVLDDAVTAVSGDCGSLHSPESCLCTYVVYSDTVHKLSHAGYKVLGGMAGPTSTHPGTLGEGSRWISKPWPGEPKRRDRAEEELRVDWCILGTA